MIPDVRYSTFCGMYVWLLLGAIAAEVFATSSLRAATDADVMWIWWALAVAGYGISFALFFAALVRGAPLAESYAVWAGLGVAATAVVGWLVFSERMSSAVVAGIILVIVGVSLIEMYGRGSQF